MDNSPKKRSKARALFNLVAPLVVIGGLIIGGIILVKGVTGGGNEAVETEEASLLLEDSSLQASERSSSLS